MVVRSRVIVVGTVVGTAVVFVTVVHRVSTDPVQPIGVVVGSGVLLVRPGQFVTVVGH